MKSPLFGALTTSLPFVLSFGTVNALSTSLKDSWAVVLLQLDSWPGRLPHRQLVIGRQQSCTDQGDTWNVRTRFYLK